MKITLVAGARPNFMKIAPIIKALRNKQAAGKNVAFRLVHTGQHYDRNLSDTFFEELHIPEPDVNLEVKSGSQAVQTAAIMVAFEKELEQHPADLVLVVGDVNSTMACAIVAKKMHVKVAHVEAGIRSGDWTMPEEVNRVVTDSISDYFFTTSPSATENLIRSGVSPDAVHFVGNVMIDTLLQNKDRFQAPEFASRFGLSRGNYLVLTLHRPSNVDQPEHLVDLLTGIDALAEDKPVVFPIHPRTEAILAHRAPSFKNIRLVAPQGYLNFMHLVSQSFAVITDSGGLSEEITVLGIPCFTMRTTTERPETITTGTNTLVGTSVTELSAAYKSLLANGRRSAGIPELWDGRAAERLVDILLR